MNLIEFSFDMENARIYPEVQLLVVEKPADQCQFIELLKSIEKLVKRYCIPGNLALQMNSY